MSHIRQPNLLLSLEIHLLLVIYCELSSRELPKVEIIVDDVPATASTLKEVVGVDRYRGGSDQFTALGDEHGLLLVMKRGRILNFKPWSQEKAGRVFRTGARVRGPKQTKYVFAEFPYELSVEA